MAATTTLADPVFAGVVPMIDAAATAAIAEVARVADERRRKALRNAKRVRDVKCKLAKNQIPSTVDGLGEKDASE